MAIREYMYNNTEDARERGKQKKKTRQHQVIVQHKQGERKHSGELIDKRRRYKLSRLKVNSSLRHSLTGRDGVIGTAAPPNWARLTARHRAPHAHVIHPPPLRARHMLLTFAHRMAASLPAHPSHFGSSL